MDRLLRFEDRRIYEAPSTMTGSKPLHLPEHLAERQRAVGDGPFRSTGAFVLYWMRTAVRAHENPALDSALALGRELGLPVFVYHALSEQYPYASDRHHTFILEGARDVQRALTGRRIAYAFHLARPGHRGRHLVALAERAAVVVTEEMPVRPLRAWTERLARASDTPVWAVDTSCIVPMRLAGRAFDRAFAYRRATDRERNARVEREWAEIDDPSEARLPDLPFDPVDLRTADIPALVAACDIDHTVGPVPDTAGGSTAGYARWEAFKRDGLKRYASDRNDPLQDGVSRMSAYLHYGHVSPFRLARETAAVGGKGAAKYLDELLVWRELAYTYCFHREDHATLATLPSWARETLSEHARDPRSAVLSHETLARAKTGDRLWDAAQRSLRIHGELHNNVRMTWGKALLSWTPDPGTALERLIDLNHRFALDGRDPSSYGGILWCLGQFDRPFSPERPILGSVRARPLESHASRLDVEAYARRTGRPFVSPAPRIAVIGAGLSGLTCARTLGDHGCDVVVFDKGRRPGGRMSTRVTDHGSLDHGAQYFTVRDERFARCVESWIDDGVVAEWDGRVAVVDGEGGRPTPDETRRYVGVPEMNRVAAWLAADCHIRSHTRIHALERRGSQWFVEHDTAAEGPFDAVVVAVPAPQAVLLLDSAPRLQQRVAKVRMHPCWALMMAFPQPVDPGFEAAMIREGPLSWIARNGCKPGRSGETWVLHASPEWTERNLESRDDRVLARMLDAFAGVVRIELPEASFSKLHRWRYALPVEPLGEPCLFDGERAIAVCGDWCVGARVEAAYLSGAAAAGRLLGRFSGRDEPDQPSLF